MKCPNFNANRALLCTTHSSFSHLCTDSTYLITITIHNSQFNSTMQMHLPLMLLVWILWCVVFSLIIHPIAVRLIYKSKLLSKPNDICIKILRKINRTIQCSQCKTKVEHFFGINDIVNEKEFQIRLIFTQNNSQSQCPIGHSIEIKLIDV